MIEAIIITVVVLIGIDVSLSIAAKIRRAKAEKNMAESAKELAQTLVGEIKKAGELHEKMHAEEEAKKAQAKVATKKPVTKKK